MNRDRALAAFLRAYPHEPTHWFRAPGRVNLIGEHTDYNDGFVLPCAIDRETVVAARLTGDGSLMSIAAEDAPSPDRLVDRDRYDPGEYHWSRYVHAVATVLAAQGIRPSAQIAFAGDVPLGSGLSSSASLEMAVGAALVGLLDLTLPPNALAKIAMEAENDYVGTQCGIMDQLIAERGIAGHAMLIDCRSLDCQPVRLPDGVSILIAHSGVRHAHAGGEYNDRRAECRRAAAHFGVEALRDLDPAQLEEGRAGLDDVAYRRARHVVSENARTIAAAEALRSGDLGAMGRLMAQSHASMRDDFEITVPAVDTLVEIISAVVCGDGGARMTGGGFGGCVVSLVPEAMVRRVEDRIAEAYRDPAGKPAEVFVCKASNGAGPLQAFD